MNENTSTSIHTMVEQALAATKAFEPATEFRYTTVPASKLVAGDTLVGYKAGEKVVSTRPGTSKTIVTTDGRKTELRFDHSEGVAIGRHYQTDASQAAQKALRAEYVALKHIADRVGGTEAKEAKLAEYVAQGWWERVAEIAAELASTIPVRGDYLNAAKAVEEGRYTAVKAIEELRKSWTKALVNGYDSPTWSGGFTVKNAVLQDMSEARRKAFSDTEWLY